MKLKTTIALAVTMIAAMGAASAATYTYDGNTADWYTAGNFTRAQNADPTLPYLINDANVSNAIRGIYFNRNGIGQVFCDSWAGATWQAPTGEKIIRVTLTSWYRTDYGQMGIGVFGGDSSFEETNYLKLQTPANPSWPWHDWTTQPIVVDINGADNVSKLELRSFWMTTNEMEMLAGANMDGSYQGLITSVNIETQAVPEPGAISLALLGLVGVIARKRK